MFEFYDEYKTNKRIAMKDFIPKFLKPEMKKKIRDNVCKVTLTYQIMGEKIPSLVTEDYNYQVVQVYDFEVKDLKKATFLGILYQEIIKAPCILHIHDNNKEVYSLALKRLNKQEQTEIVVTDTLLTEPLNFGLPDMKKTTMGKYIGLSNVINKTNKLSYYNEIFVKLYILENDNLYSKIQAFLDKPIWYDTSKVNNLYAQLKLLENNKNKLLKAITNAEKVKINQEIRMIIHELEMM